MLAGCGGGGGGGAVGVDQQAVKMVNHCYPR